MHDPLTVAFEIKYPWKKYAKTKGGLLSSDYRESLITIWHKDPCKDGSDDSCGWFKRAKHGDTEVLEKIVKRFEFDWDSTFQSENALYSRGLFHPSGDPHLSVSGIVLNLFFTAVSVHFEVDGRSNWKKSRRWMKRNLFDILIFAENPTDSLFDGITRKFEIGCKEEHTPERRKERIKRMAACIYGWILRQERPWYRHPRWHVWHWRLQIHPWQQLKRGLFDRCCKCHKRFKFGESPISDWNGTRIWHQRCDDSQNPAKDSP
jgi:hypothetical protein